MNKVVVDTDLLIDNMRGFEKAEIFLKRVESREIWGYCSTITEAEMYSGSECASIEKQARIAALLSTMEKVAVSSEIAFKAGEFRRRYGTSLTDSIIAATAYHLKAKLATRNKSDFGRIKEVSVLVPY